jgi:hypothetical protein
MSYLRNAQAHRWYHPMPRPAFPRPSKLRSAANRRGDDAEFYFGGWSRARLISMDRRFRDAMAREVQPAKVHSPGEGILRTRPC